MLIREQRRGLQDNLRRLAFTLMEMLIVVAIIVMLAGLGGYYVIGRYEEAKVSTARFKAQQISNAIKTYYIDHDEYPNDLSVLLQKSALGKGPYLTKQDDILDPWGRPYTYDQSGQQNAANGDLTGNPDVFTTAPDGRTIGNWAERKQT